MCSYINNLDEFTINAGLIINNKPVAGLIDRNDPNSLERAKSSPASSAFSFALRKDSSIIWSALLLTPRNKAPAPVFALTTPIGEAKVVLCCLITANLISYILVC